MRRIHIGFVTLVAVSATVACGDRPGPDTGGEGPGFHLELETIDDLHGELVQLAREGAFSGVVLVAEGDEVVFRRAYGVAERRSMRPVLPDTRFDIGSIGKLFTSVAILRLAQEGYLELDDPVGTHTDALGSDLGRRITIRHLLQHRSGLGDYLSHPHFRAQPERFRRVDDYMELVPGENLAFEPGEEVAYSNSGFVVLGHIVEVVTGRRYHNVVAELVLAPAGMTSTSPGRHEQSASGYTRTDRGGLGPTDDRWPPVGSPAGGSHSTADDLHRFVRALMEDRLLDSPYTDTLIRNYEGPSDDPVDRRGRWDIGWSGGAEGLNSAVGYDAGTDRSVVVLSNFDPPAAIGVAQAVVGLFRSSAKGRRLHASAAPRFARSNARFIGSTSGHPRTGFGQRGTRPGVL